VVDARHQCRHGGVFDRGHFQQSKPEIIFQGNAGLPSVDVDGMLADGGFHAALFSDAAVLRKHKSLERFETVTVLNFRLALPSFCHHFIVGGYFEHGGTSAFIFGIPGQGARFHGFCY